MNAKTIKPTHIINICMIACLVAIAVGAVSYAWNPPSLSLPLKAERVMPKPGENFGEGTLLAYPTKGVDPNLARLTEPGVMSIVFSDEAVAREFYDEAVSNGEQVCLSDLGAQPEEFRGQRWWLRSC